MNSDAIMMLDSPAQTPTPKSQPPPPNGTSSDVPMSDSTAIAAPPTNWMNNGKWVDEYKAVDARLLHRDAFKRREDAPTTAAAVPTKFRQAGKKRKKMLLLIMSRRLPKVNLRDPMDPPLVNDPPSITPQLEVRLRELVRKPRDLGGKDKEMAN